MDVASYELAALLEQSDDRRSAVRSRLRFVLKRRLHQDSIEGQTRLPRFAVNGVVGTNMAILFHNREHGKQLYKQLYKQVCEPRGGISHSSRLTSVPTNNLPLVKEPNLLFDLTCLASPDALSACLGLDASQLRFGIPPAIRSRSVELESRHAA